MQPTTGMRITTSPAASHQLYWGSWLKRPSPKPPKLSLRDNTVTSATYGLGGRLVIGTAMLPGPATGNNHHVGIINHHLGVS